MAHDIKLGQLIDESQLRDAIHIAVAPVQAADMLYPGQHIGFIDDKNQRVSGQSKSPIGIVDPFLTHQVHPDQRCFMFLYPQTVTGMRHDWTHPAFAGEASSDVSASEKWMRAFAEEIGLGYAVCMRALQESDDDGEYYCFQGHDTPDACYKKREEMWKHYEIITGKKPSDPTRCAFTCSC